MNPAAATVKLDDDVQEELRKLAERSGRSLGALANEALRGFVRHENQVTASIERGVADLEVGAVPRAAEVGRQFGQRRLGPAVGVGGQRGQASGAGSRRASGSRSPPRHSALRLTA